MTRPICIVVDTNIWRETLLLRSGLGPALLHVIHRRGGRLGLPEVVETEIHKHLLRAGVVAVEDIQRGARDLRTILGAFPETMVPVQDKISGSISARLDDLAPILVRGPMTLGHARAALKRVNDETPPNGPKNQQFKDSLIWESVCELAQAFDVAFVTKDSGFFKDKEKSEAATSLRDEVDAKGLTLRVYSDLTRLLEALRADMPDINQALIANAAYDAVREDVARDAATKMLRLGNLVDFQISPFVTENHDVLAVSFSVVPEVIDFDEDSGRSDCRLRAEGQCSYSLSQCRANNPLLDRIEYSWTDATGEPRTIKSVYARLEATLGGRQRMVPHTIKEELP